MTGVGGSELEESPGDQRADSLSVIRDVRKELTPRLVDALVEVSVFSPADGRDLLRETLEQSLGGLNVRHFAAPKPAAVELVSRCAERPGGLGELAGGVELLAGGEPACLEVRRIVEQIEALRIEPQLEKVWPELEPALTRLPLRETLPVILQVTEGRIGVLPRHCDTTWTAFAHLVGQNGDGPIPPWMTFLEVVRDRLDDDVARRVRELLRRLAQQWQATAELEETRGRYHARTPRPTKAGVLTIVVDPDPVDPDVVTLYSIRRWEDDASAPVRDEELITSRSKVKAAVQEVVARAEEAWSATSTELKLEFVLPVSLLNEAVEWWPKEPHNAPASPLAVYHSVVLRSLERLRKTTWHRVWRQRWERLTTDPNTVEVLRVADPERKDHLRRLEAELAGDGRCVGIVLSSPPQPDAENDQEIMVALRAGIPLILWRRSGPLTAAARQVINDLLTALPEVPERLARQRRQAEGLEPDEREAHPVRDVSLLWDNAHRAPRMPLAGGS